MRYFVKNIFYIALLLVSLLIIHQVKILPSEEKSEDFYEDLQYLSDSLAQEWHAKGCVDADKLKDSVLVVSRATGFFLTSNMFITNDHVTRETQGSFKAESFYEYSNSITMHREVKMMYTNSEDDISIINIDKGHAFLNPKPVKLARSNPSEGEIVMYIGNPNTHRYKVGYGKVDNKKWMPNYSGYPIRNMASFVKVIYITGHTSGGNSGSPIFNCGGEVVGIHIASNIKAAGRIEDLYALAIPVVKLRESIAKSDIVY